jgi:hypothetical protein
MSDRMLANSALAFSPPIATSPSSARPVAARTKSLLEGPVLPTLLRTANAVRLVASTGSALVAIYWLDLGAIGFFVAIAGGFCAYAALTSAAILRVKQASASPPG